MFLMPPLTSNGHQSVGSQNRVARHGFLFFGSWLLLSLILLLISMFDYSQSVGVRGAFLDHGPAFSLLFYVGIIEAVIHALAARVLYPRLDPGRLLTASALSSAPIAMVLTYLADVAQTKYFESATGWSELGSVIVAPILSTVLCVNFISRWQRRA